MLVGLVKIFTFLVVVFPLLRVTSVFLIFALGEVRVIIVEVFLVPVFAIKEVILFVATFA